MSDPIRDPSSNISMGWIRMPMLAIMGFLKNNPPMEGDKELTDYIEDLGIPKKFYSVTCRVITHREPTEEFESMG